MTTQESPVPHEDQAMAQAAAWVARLGGDVTGEDGVEFDAWLEAAPGNRAAFGRVVALMQEFDARAADVLKRLAPQGRPVAAPASAAPVAFSGSARTPERRRSPMRWMVPAGGFALAA